MSKYQDVRSVIAQLFFFFAMLVSSVALLSFILHPDASSPLSVMKGLCIVGYRPIIEVLFAFMCLYGAGHVVSHLLIKDNEREHLSLGEFFFFCMLLGMVAVAGLFFFLGMFGLLYKEIILSVKILFSLIGFSLLINMIRGEKKLIFSVHHRRDVVEITLQFVMLSLILIALLNAYTSPFIFIDALAYHYGYPWLYLLNHSIHFYPHLLSSGQYTAGDLLYLLTIHSNNPWNIFSTNLFNACVEALLFIAIFFSVIRNGVSKIYAYFACILMFSVSSIGFWGSGKNDLILAGLCLSVFWLFKVFDTYRTRGWLYSMFLLGGYTVSVKMNAIPVLFIGGILFLFYYAKARLSWKDLFTASIIGAVPIIPWSLFALYYRGNPVYPFFNMNKYMLAGWAARDTSGLTLSFENFFKHLFPLITGNSTYSRGIYTGALGYIFLFAAFYGAFILNKKEVKQFSYFYIVGMLNLIAFLLLYFEIYIQMRYFLFSAAVVFIFFSTALALSSESTTLYRKIALLVIVALSVIQGPMLDILNGMKNDPIRMQYIIGKVSKNEYIKSFSLPYESVHRYIHDHLRLGEKVLINDAVVFGLKSDFINVHSLHSDYVRYDKIDATQFADLLKQEGVSIALIRPGISGITSQLNEFLNTRMIRVQQIPPYDIYVLKVR